MPSIGGHTRYWKNSANVCRHDFLPKYNGRVRIAAFDSLASMRRWIGEEFDDFILIETIRHSFRLMIASRARNWVYPRAYQ